MTIAELSSPQGHRQQRRGIGRRLLEHVLERADTDSTPVCLETSGPAKLGLYEKFGFHTTARIDGGTYLPTFWVMVHPAPPQTRPAAKAMGADPG